MNTRATHLPRAGDQVSRGGPIPAPRDLRSRAWGAGPGPLLQRKCACGGTAGPDGECEACRKKRLQRFESCPGGHEPAEAPPIVHEVLRASGQPLDRETRSLMESRLGHDFSRVRLHTDARAADSARAVNALAYTVGHQVVFGGGQHAPSTTAGRRLLAHELVHVVQQSGHQRTAEGPLAVDADAALEREAERSATGFDRDGRARPPAPLGEPMVQRYVDTSQCVPGGPCPPPPPPRSPVQSCAALSHVEVMLKVARQYVRDELDASAADTLLYQDCVSPFSLRPCIFEFTSGYAVKLELLLLDAWAPPGVGRGLVFVEEAPPLAATDLTHPYFRRRDHGRRCRYVVNCPQPTQLTLYQEGCRGLRGPGDYPTLPDNERIA